MNKSKKLNKNLIYEQQKLIDDKSLTKIQLLQLVKNLCQMQTKQKIICLCGNDGTGKSTLSKLIPQMSPQIYVIQRSSKELPSYLQALRQEIKHIDVLTYRYSFEKEREIFQPSTSVRNENGQTFPVSWVMLHLQPTEIFKRISKRVEMGIYESKKCVQYYSYVYLELAAYYGMTVVDVNGSPQQNATKIAQIISNGAAQQIKKINLKTLTLQKIIQLDVETQIIKSLNNENILRLINEKWLEQLRQNESEKHLYFPEIQEIVGNENGFNLKLGQKIAARWIINNFAIVKDSTGNLEINLEIEDFKQTISLSSLTFVHFVQGQSKKIYSLRSNIEFVEQHFSSRIWILLKSTIYSHTKQHTGEITDLGKVRAIGSNLFLQMLRRNNLKHAYIAINKEGIIFSRKIKTNNVQIVFKRQYVGTDKHSYNLMDLEESIVDKQNKYQSGIYIRFDWRNPNHFIRKFPKYIINLSPYYYIIQKEIGKQTFFKKFLNQSKVTPWGDKCISEDLISNYVETSKIKRKILSLYCTFSYYCKKVGLDIIDGCFMLDNQGQTVWSEINPDCMRVKKNELNSRQNYDKDIWRIGGSSSKEKILEKWSLFNKLLIDYFVQNRFHLTELLQTTPLSYPNSEQARLLLNSYSDKMPKEYVSALETISQCTQQNKELIATIDISDGKPMLVKSSQLSENHSSCDLAQAHSYIKVLPKIVLVDLDAAMDKQVNNRNHIKKLAIKPNSNIFGVGGGIRSIQVLKYYLNKLLIPKVIISTNLQLLKQISRQIIQQRIIVELSINQDNQILTHGRKVNTHENVIKKMIELAQFGVKVVSLTFNHKEGHLLGIPRAQFRDIMFQIPGPIDKVIIAGGISSLEDLQYIWGFPKAVPQLGSAIWKHKISIGDLCNQIINFNDDGLCPAIITDLSQKLLGQVFMNKQAIKMTCQTRKLHRYSRKLGRLIKKGEQSGNTQKIVSFRYDCDKDCLNIIVENSENPFCHLQCQSCFDYESQHRSQNILSLQHHILRKKESGSGYTKRLQQNQHLALSKYIQQSFQFSLSKNRIVEQGADVISHMLMYLNSKGISFSQIMKELEVRSVQVKQPKITQKEENKIDYIGVMGGKHYEKIDKSMLDTLGIRVIRPKNRSLKLDYIIENQTKFDVYFKGKNIKLIGIKSKDMALLLSKRHLSYCFNYSIMMENSPKIWVQHFRAPIAQIKLVLLSRKNEQIDPLRWNPSQKGRIVAEYPRSVANYFESLGVCQNSYNLIQVSGGTQSYLQINDFDYCDAIVESGRTIEQNNLHIVKILAESIQAALYSLVQ